MAMTFGAYLDAAMKARGFNSAADLSRATGIGDGVLSKWLNDVGKEPPRVDSLRRLVSILDIPLLTLMVAAYLVTPEEAGLPDFPEPPEPTTFEDIDKLIDRTGMPDEDKAEFRANLARLTGHRFSGTGPNIDNGGENSTAKRKR